MGKFISRFLGGGSIPVKLICGALLVIVAIYEISAKQHIAAAFSILLAAYDFCSAVYLFIEKRKFKEEFGDPYSENE